MPFNMTVDHRADILVVEAAGPASLGDLCGLFDFVRVTAEKNGHRRALLDLRAVENDLRFTDHLALGAHAADELQNMERVASVVDPKYRVGTSEKAAQKMGLRFRTFVDLDEARTWVMGTQQVNPDPAA
jgi:hypothetical protein